MAIVKQIDHIVVHVVDPRPLFTLLTETLALPTAWPLRSYGAFASGGVACGNVNIEVLQLGGEAAAMGEPFVERPAPEPSGGAAKLAGFGFEPEPLPQALEELDRRGLAHGPPVPFAGPRADGSEGVLWTNVLLAGLSGDAMIFLCAYEHDVVARRAVESAALRAIQGGPLVLLGVKEVVVGLRELEAGAQLWRTLLDPVAEDAPGLWQLGGGPAIRLVADCEDRVQALVWQVASLKRVKKALQAKGLLGASAGGELTISAEKLGGLTVRLVD